MKYSFLFLILILSSCQSKRPNMESSTYAPTLTDEYQWLVDSSNSKVDAWVKKQNQITQNEFAQDQKSELLRKMILNNINDPFKIPYGKVTGDYYYHFLKNDNFKNGLWRRIKVTDLVSRKKTWQPFHVPASNC